MLETVVNGKVGDVVEFDGFSWKIQKVEGSVAFVSKVVDGKVQRGRTRKVLLNLFDGEVPEVESADSDLKELLF